MLIVIMIGLLAFVAVTGLLGHLVPRQRTVSGEALSDRSLALADGFIDQLLANINTQGELTKSAPGATAAQDAVIRTLLAGLNGGNPDTDSLDAIRKKVRSYVYDTSTSTYYRLGSDAVYTKGILTSGTLMSVDGLTSYGSLTAKDSSFVTDNRWYQIDTNCDYDYAPGKNDIWGLRVSAFNISKPELRRTVQADAGRGAVALTGEPNWYARVVGPNGYRSYCAYAGFYNNGVAYGKYEVINGPIRSNGSVDMGGWALDNVYAHTSVSDGSGDTGRFGPLKYKLNDAHIGDYVFSNYPKATWDDGTAILYGSNPARAFGADTGIQDKCSAGYYVNGNATVVFSNPGGVGKVTINGVTTDLPLKPTPPVVPGHENDGALLIFVEGNANVEGTVNGRVTLGCRGTINITNNVLYSIPPAVNRSDVRTDVTPDALGLIAGQQVFIPKATYDRTTLGADGKYHHLLEIDAAMFSGTGGLKIDPNAGTHQETVDPHYEAYWNGSQTMKDATQTPLVEYGGGTVRGYELQHTNFDWYLKDYGAPAMFPGTGTQAIAGEVDFVLVRDAGILSQLAGVTPTAVSTSDPEYDARYPFRYVLGSTKYYTAGAAATYYATYSPDSALLSRYRVSWKEQIATPVRQP
jgi:hypothetical protein